MTPSAPSVSVVIVNWNAGAVLSTCLASLPPRDDAPYEVILVDNASPDGSSARAASEFPDVRLVMTGDNLGFAAGANRGAAAARGDIIVFLNPDAQLVPGAMAVLTAAVRGDPRVGIAGGGLRHPDGTWQPAAAHFGACAHLVVDSRVGRIVGRYRARPHAVDWVYGTFMAIRRDLFRRLGGFEERYFMYGEDMDLCWRAHAEGVRILHVPTAVALHGANVSARQRFGRDRDAAVLRGELRFYALRLPHDLTRFRTWAGRKQALQELLARARGAADLAAAAAARREVCRTWKP